MEQYISKAALVAEIKRRIKEIPKDETDKRLRAVYGNEAFVLMELLSFLDTLEVKDVDLDKEIRHYRMRNPIIQHREESLYDYMANVAKHFFELGLKAKNI